MKKTLLAILLTSSFNASALTTEQNLLLKNWALSDTEASTCITNGDDGCLTNRFNAASTFVVWKTRVSQDEIMQSSTFDWTRVDNLTNGKARIWAYMFDNQSKAINPTNANIRLGIDATWVGTAADLAVRASVYEKCKKFATNAEQVLSSGTGTTVSPGILSFEGNIQNNWISEILGRQ